MEEDFELTIFRANLCEKAELFDEMVTVMQRAMKKLNKEDDKNHSKARNLFSVAFKNLVSKYRSSWRILCSEKEAKEGKDERIVAIIDGYMKDVEKDLKRTCDAAIASIDALLKDFPALKDSLESNVFFLKMKGDYYRYKAEICGEENQSSSFTGEPAEDNKEYLELSDLSNQNYEKAMGLSINLPHTNPIRLGLALNYSVYLYEIRKDTIRAKQVAKDAFDSALTGLENLKEDYYKDSTLIMQLLRDNMTLWNNEDTAIDAEHMDNENRNEENN